MASEDAIALVRAYDGFAGGGPEKPDELFAPFLRKSGSFRYDAVLLDTAPAPEPGTSSDLSRAAICWRSALSACSRWAVCCAR